MNRFARSLGALCLLLIPGPALAQDAEPEDADPNAEEAPAEAEDDSVPDAEFLPPADGRRLEPVTAVGTRSAVPLTEQAPNVTVADQEDIYERSFEVIGDVIDEEPGVHLQITNRGAGAPFIRGQVGPGNLIVFDGMRFNNGTFRTGPNQYLNLFDLYAMESIEVLRGDGGVFYGSGTIGGVVSLNPRIAQFDRGVYGQAVAGFRSADLSYYASPEVGWSNETFAVLFGGTFNDFNELRAGGGDEIPASAYSNFSARGSLGARFGDGQLHVNYFGTFIDDAGRVERIYDSNFRQYENDNHFAYARYQHDGTGALRSLRASVFLNQNNEFIPRNDCATTDLEGVTDVDGEAISVSADPFGCIDGDYDAINRQREQSDDTRMIGTNLAVRSDLPVDGLSLFWGFDAATSNVTSEEVRFNKPDPPVEGEFEREERRGNFSDDSTFTQLGAYTQLGYVAEVGDTEIAPEAGLRVAHIRAGAPDVPGLGDVEYDYTGVVGRARLRTTFKQRYSVFAGWAQGFRSPNLQETTNIGDTGNTFEIPNDNLGPERSDTYELGARYATPERVFELTGFLLDVSDVITREDATFEGQSEVDGTQVVRRINADSAQYYGLEGAFDTDIWNGLSLRGNGSWIIGELTRDGETENVRRNPPVRWLAALRWTFDQRNAFVELLAEGALEQDRLSPGDEGDLRICQSDINGVLFSDLGQGCPGTPGWTTLGVRGSTDINDVLRLRASVTNLLDAQYRTHGSGFDAAGVSGNVQLEARF